MSDTTQKFTVRYDAGSRTLHWRMAGFWNPEDVTAFALAMRAAVEPLGDPTPQMRGLCDSRDFPVQSAEVAQALGHLNRMIQSVRRGPTAIVVGSMMNKLQAERALQSPNLRVFLDMEEARAWLDQHALQ
ncbi:hypothetical protein HJG53_09650 [Sphingomonas sp. ID1715]|uniref:hypothetical protein n=1 Tax=Sphingomonas sp. ID1715 TaxID=1656898 RepID=UPI001489F240|nr:hypothetical protein [Sphingomonas sp. ID1715]NNM77165.1 hypothetical protein [Sphingomonas sp. ID1715]